MRRRDRRRSLALGASVVLHSLFGAWLLTSALRTGTGAGVGTAIGAGPGLAVSLVSALPSSREAPSQVETRNLLVEQPQPAKPEPLPADQSLVDPTPTPATETSPQSEQADSVRTASSGAPAQSGGGGNSDSSGVLAEVARCLPAGLRPRLALTTLTLAANQDGALSAAPVVTFAGPNVSKDDARTADLIVQAALQCGPYQNPSLKGGTLVLPADFGDLETPSSIQATLK